MIESLIKSMASIVDDLNKNENVNKDKYSVDVTTDEGIAKVRDSIYNIKGNIKSLKENFNDSWFKFFWDKKVLNNIEETLDDVLANAEKKYKEAHRDGDKNQNTKIKTKINDIRPILRLTNEEASKVYNAVNKYLDTEIIPKLNKDKTTATYIQSIKESFVDFAAWFISNKY